MIFEKQKWPKVDADALIKQEVNMVIQVNGKLRASMVVSVDNSEEKNRKEAIKQASVAKYVTKYSDIKKIIYIKNKLINIVI